MRLNIVLSLAIGITLATGCNNSDFAGSNKAKNLNDGPKQPGDDDATSSDPGSNEQVDKNNDGIDDNTGKPIVPAGGLSSSEGFASAKRVPLKMIFDTSEASYSGSYQNGEYEYRLTKRQGGLPDVVLHKFNSGAVGSKEIPDVCACGKDNIVTMMIKADGKDQDITAWKRELMVSATRPTGDIDDWSWWLEDSSRKNLPTGAVYIGGFDQTEVSGDKCGSFACDERKWSNRDDTRIILYCQTDLCPEKTKGFSFKITGMDP